MLNQIITRYLESNKRLVIPQLGAFIVKTPGQSIVFSVLLKRDDGILRGLLRAEGMNELEAAGEIDRFTFEIRHAMQHGEAFQLEGLGTMTPGPNDTILFENTPQAIPGPVAPAEHLEPPHRPTGPTQVDPEPKVSPSVKLNPEPYVKGLRYGKPHKNTDAYTFAPSGRRRVDRFMLIAIVAAVIAVAALAFGYFIQSRADQADEQIQTEQPATPTTDEAAEHQPQTPAQR